MSTTYSKFYHEHIAKRTCQNFIHPETCRQHLSKNVLLYLISNFKYFAPICFLPALVHMRSLNKKKLKKTLEYYLSCSLVGFSVGCCIDFLICFLRNIFGRFGYFTFAFVPSLLGANLIYLGSNRVINMFENSLFQCIFETFFLMRGNSISRTIGSSKLLQTLMFMLCSCIILHGKQCYNTQGFWILTPNPKLQCHENMVELQCKLHPQSSCKKYLVEGMRNYFILGLTLDAIKMLMSKAFKRTSQGQAWQLVQKLRNFRIRSATLLTAYIGIYRFAHCFLNRKNFYDDRWNHLISAFLAGSCYYLYPQFNLFNFSLVLAIRNLWSTFEYKQRDTKNVTIRYLLKIPYARLLIPFTLANLVHLSVQQPKYISNLANALTNGVSNFYPTHIRKQIESIMKQHYFKNH